MIEVYIDQIILESVDEIAKSEMKKTIENIVKNAIEEEQLVFKSINVSITAADKEEIKSLNNTYRNKDNSTDVLSFPIFTLEELKNIKFEEIELGDIVVCLDIVKEQAIEYQTGMKRELLYMITHGMFHLLGYDHEVLEEKKIMRSKEENILNKIGVEF